MSAAWQMPDANTTMQMNEANQALKLFMTHFILKPLISR
jgi:hypothetical protein